MSNYKELQAISKKYIGKEVFKIAADLGITIKNDADCLNDFSGFSPLNNHYAILTSASGGYVIYYKPCEYEEYYILHELCHYILKHNADGEYEEQQSNILACMILISNKDIHKDIFTLSARYNIPSHIVYSYITYLKSNTSIFYKRKALMFVSVAFSASFLFVSGTFIGTHIGNNTPDTTPVLNFTEVTTEQSAIFSTQSQSIATEIVYITKYGSKYHKPNCYYIKNSETISITAEQAQYQGYTPCAICFNN